MRKKTFYVWIWISGLATFLAGCGGAGSYVYIDELGVQYPIVYADHAKADDTEIYWAVGDNSEAFRPALCAPNPGAYRYWCLGVCSHQTNPRAVYVERVSGENRYQIYELKDLKIVLSDKAIKGEGDARIQWTDRHGKLLEQPPSTVFPHSTGFEFVLHRPIKGHDRRLRVILDDLRPVVELLLLDNGHE